MLFTYAGLVCGLIPPPTSPFHNLTPSTHNMPHATVRFAISHPLGSAYGKFIILQSLEQIYYFTYLRNIWIRGETSIKRC